MKLFLIWPYCCGRAVRRITWQQVGDHIRAFPNFMLAARGGDV